MEGELLQKQTQVMDRIQEVYIEAGGPGNSNNETHSESEVGNAWWHNFYSEAQTLTEWGLVWSWGT